MPKLPTKYVFDTSVFTEATKSFYSEDICPGFWIWLENQFDAGKVCSLERVLLELTSYEKEENWLRQWALARPTFFRALDDASNEAFQDVIEHALHHKNKLKARQFLDKADGALIAYAKAHHLIVVTQEKHSQEGLKIPSVCREFGVGCYSILEFARAEGLRLELAQVRPVPQATCGDDEDVDDVSP